MPISTFMLISKFFIEVRIFNCLIELTVIIWLFVCFLSWTCAFYLLLCGLNDFSGIIFCN